MKSLVLLLYFVYCGELKKLDLRLVIPALDSTVLKKVKNPEVGGGENVLEGIVLYNRSFVQLVRLMKKKEDSSIKDMVLNIIEQRGPKILRHRLDKALIKEKFSWSDEDFAHLINRLTETFVLWKEFKKTFLKDSAWFTSD